MGSYKIQHKETGLFSNGIVYATRWSKTGKTWPSMSNVKSHLRQVSKVPGKLLEMENWNVIEIVTEEISHGTFGIFENSNKGKK